MFQHLTSQKMTVDFLASEAVLGASEVTYIIFFLKITSEMDSAYQKTYVSTPHITDNDSWLLASEAILGASEASDIFSPIILYLNAEFISEVILRII